MKKNRDIWPSLKDRYGNAIPRPQYRSGFSSTMQQIRKIKAPLPKGRFRKWKPMKSAYPIGAILKSWGILILLVGVFSWIFMEHFM